MERVLACVSSYSLVKITLLHGSMSCEKQSPLPQGMEEKSHIVTYTIHTIFKLCVRTIRNARNSSSSTHITANCLLPCWLQLILIFGQSHLPQLCLSSSPPPKKQLWIFFSTHSPKSNLFASLLASISTMSPIKFSVSRVPQNFQLISSQSEPRMVYQL